MLAQRARHDDGESGGENEVAFSSSSARRCARSVTARPATASAWSTPSSSTRGKSAISAAAGAHDVDDRDRLLPLTRLLGTGQDEKALRIAPHPGRHVIELEQRVEGARVVLVALQVVQKLQLALQQALVAAGEVDEQVAHAGAEQP